MKPHWLAAAGLVLAASAWAQNAPIQTESLPPLQQQWQQQGRPPVPQAPTQQPPAPPSLVPAPSPLVQQPPLGQPLMQQPPASPPLAQQPPLVPPQQVPGLPATADQGAQGQAAAPPAVAAPPVTFDRPNIWLPATTVKLQALDKVNAQSSALSIKVGQSATFGSLTITAKACVVRPTDQPADAAAYLDVTDSHPDSPSFDGWILQDEPSVSMMQHPIYDLRVAGCT